MFIFNLPPSQEHFICILIPPPSRIRGPFSYICKSIGPITILREITILHYEEAVRLRKNPDWFYGNFIHLPEWAQQKAKRKQRERWVRLSIPGKYVMMEFFSITVPSRIALDKWLAYNFPLIEGLSAKSFRKMWESWLLFSYPDKAIEIALSQGHTELTQLRHYANLPFLDKDREEMKEFVVEWA